MTVLEQRAYEAIIAMRCTLQEMYEDQPSYWERFTDQCARSAMQTLIPQCEKMIACAIDDHEEVTKEMVDSIVQEQIKACAKRSHEYARALAKQLKGE